jgi:hypothetical protein
MEHSSKPLKEYEMKKILIALLLMLMSVPAYAVDFTDTDNLYGWNGTTQFYPTYLEFKAQLQTDLTFFITAPKNAQFIFTDLTSVYTGEYVQIDAGTWTTADILCDATETTTAIEFDIYTKTSIDAVASVITAAELTMSTINPYVVGINISALTDPVDGAWIRVDIATPADTAASCTLSLNY